ncbi:ammonium transporter [Tateyamaria omphalii]|uniref:ammonium transporter n=1 Tax=Tateyamaria omphalii TaxID=299262 RepID=UPI001C995EDA|nr:ammonium transporter [Tateyamaria omphalii]MBY5934850.1 ammonium transporter [Tateyamaria omphalii]
MNHADIGWVMVATAMVFFMSLPGLILFYGGMVRARNVISLMVQCYAVACMMALLWFVLGYSIAFGDGNAFWGGLGKVALLDVTLGSMVGTLPETLFFAFQMTFAIITPVIILGACAERTKFGFILLFSSLWMLLVYAPVAHWVWGGGFLSDGGLFGETGVRDFAGGLVVHETAGISALMLTIVIGRRAVSDYRPHNPGMVMVGASILWFGWLGFNGGSQLAADAGAARAVTVTILAGATASVTWIGWEYVKTGKITLVGMVTGTLAGLAAVTPASGFVSPLYGILIGIVAGIMCQETVYILRDKTGIDDALDVFAVHGAGGIFGSVMMAALGTASWTAQLGGIAIIAGYTAVATLILIFFCKGVIGIRVSPEIEAQGLDQPVHGQRGYELAS